MPLWETFHEATQCRTMPRPLCFGPDLVSWGFSSCIPQQPVSIERWLHPAPWPLGPGLYAGASQRVYSGEASGAGFSQASHLVTPHMQGPTAPSASAETPASGPSSPCLPSILRCFWEPDHTITQRLLQSSAFPAPLQASSPSVK